MRPNLQKNVWLRGRIAEAMDDATYMRDEADACAKMLIYLIETVDCQMSRVDCIND